MAFVGVAASVFVGIWFYDQYMTKKIAAERMKISNAQQALAAQIALQEDQITYAMTAVSVHKVSVAEKMASEGKLPNSNKEMGIPEANYYASEYLSGIAIGEGGVVYAHFKDFPSVGKSWIRFVPKIDYPDSPIYWKCESNIPTIAQLRPICIWVQ